jgi:hypothetical protein
MSARSVASRWANQTLPLEMAQGELADPIVTGHRGWSQRLHDIDREMFTQHRNV